MANEIEDGMGFSGLVESPEERRENKRTQAAKAKRILRQSQLYAAMRLVDLVNGNDVAKGTGVTEDDMMTQVDRAIEKVKQDRTATASSGDWFDTITNAIGCVRNRRTTANEQGDSDMVKHLTDVIHKLREIRRASR